jgi:hypothetical protein
MLTGSNFASIQKFERLPFWNNLSYGIKIYGFEVAFNSMTSLLNIIEIQLVQKLLVGETDRQRMVT